MEKRFYILKLGGSEIEQIVRAGLLTLFDHGCAWRFHDGSVCHRQTECECTEIRSYAGKRGQVVVRTFFCLPHAIDWAKRTGAVGADKIYFTLALQP